MRCLRLMFRKSGAFFSHTKRQAGRPTECAIKRRGDMKKTPSMFIAAAGVTAGVLDLALPAAATTGTGHPRHRELPPRTRQRQVGHGQGQGQDGQGQGDKGRGSNDCSV